MEAIPSSVYAGIARADITPPIGTRLFGYPEPERLGWTVADRLKATALVLRGETLEAAIVSLDLCMIDEDETAALRSAISAATGIPPANITLTATHTHSGPETTTAYGWAEKNRAYLEQVRPSITSAVRAASESARPITVGVATARTAVGVNRREVGPDGVVVLGTSPWGARDDTVTVIRLQGADGPVAQIVHLAAHPTARGDEPSVSRDWPGVMMDRIEALTQTPVLFLNGPCGDVAPRMATRTSAGYGAEEAREVGLRAANDALEAWHRIKVFDRVPLELMHGDVILPHAPLEALEEAERQIALLEPHAGEKGMNGCLWSYWNDVRRAHELPFLPCRKFAQTITRLGAIVMVPFPGEPFAEIGLRLRRYSPFAHTLCVGNANGAHGYFVTREGYGRGGYEAGIGRARGAYLFAVGVDDALVAGNLGMLNAQQSRTSA